jgi:hypothetical protein
MTLGGVAAAPAAAREQREEFAAMKDKSGSGSVRASMELQKLNQADTVAATRSGCAQRQLAQQTRMVQGQAFYFNNGVWVDARVQDRSRQQVQRVAFASAEYFSLLKKQPELAPVLAQGRNVRFVQGGQVFEIYDAATGE